MQRHKRCVWVAMVGLLWAAIACRPATNDTFSIHLLPADTTVEQAQVMDLTKLDVSDDPFLSIDDVVSYTQATHEIELTSSAQQRVLDLKVPTRGRMFVVCVGRKAMYWGAFWTPISSLIYDGVVIMQPIGDTHTVRIERGYPGPAFAQGEDPRSNPAVLTSLRQSGKLK